MSTNGQYELPENWVWTTISIVADTASGGTPSRSNKSYYGGAIPWVKSGELKDGIISQTEETITEAGLESSSAKIFPKGTLCIALYGATVGKLGILGIDAATNQAVCGIFLPSGIETRYLFYYLAWQRPKIVELGKGGAQPNISQGIVQEASIPLAPTAEQQRIVDEIEKQFSRLDAAVEMLQRVGRNLERLRAATLKAAVEGRLVPTEAELARAEGRDYEPADVLLQRILRERRAKWEADQLAKMKEQGSTPKDDKWKNKYREPAIPDISDLPELPKGWIWVSWEQIGFSQNGHSFPSKEYQSDGVKLLRPGNLHVSGRVVWTKENTRHLPEYWAQQFPNFIVGPKELVMNLTAQSLKDEFLGRVCLTSDSERCLLNQRIARLTPIIVLPEYLLWMFKSKIFRRFVDGLNTGSLIQHMFTSQLNTFILPLPPLAEQQRIVAEVERRISVIEELKTLVTNAQRRAAVLRQKILRDAFAGKLVPQDPADESASILLERIRAEKAAREAEADKARKERRGKMKGRKAKPSERKPRRPLLEVVAESKRRLTPEQLFAEAGFTPEVVEDFYEELRREIKAGHIEQVRPDNAKVYLIADSNA